MTTETGAPAGGEVYTSVELPADAPETFDSPREAAEYLTSLRAGKPPKEEPDESAETATADNESPQEDADPATDPSEDTTDAEPAKEPPIERPRSWTKEEDTEWQSLPRAMQQKIVAREQERDTGLRRSQNEAAEERKAIKAEREAVEQARKEYAAKLPAIEQALYDVNAAQFGDIKTVDDTTRLAETDPFRYLQWRAHQDKMQAVIFEKQKAEETQSKQLTSMLADHISKEFTALVERVPELADPVKAKDITDKAVNRLKDIGFSDQELGEYASGRKGLSIHDHRIQLLILDGLKYADIQKATKAVAAKPLPPVQKPGTPKPQGATASERIQALETRFNKTGSLKDAQALYGAQLEAQSRRRAS